MKSKRRQLVGSYSVVAKARAKAVVRGFPPEAVYALGKRKEHATKAIRALEEVLKDASLHGSNGALITQVSNVLDGLADYREKLNQP